MNGAFKKKFLYLLRRRWNYVMSRSDNIEVKHYAGTYTKADRLTSTHFWKECLKK